MTPKFHVTTIATRSLLDRIRILDPKDSHFPVITVAGMVIARNNTALMARSSSTSNKTDVNSINLMFHALTEVVDNHTAVKPALLSRTSDLLTTERPELPTRQNGDNESEHAQTHETDCDAHNESGNVPQQEISSDAHNDRRHVQQHETEREENKYVQQQETDHGKSENVEQHEPASDPNDEREGRGRKT